MLSRGNIVQNSINSNNEEEDDDVSQGSYNLNAHENLYKAQNNNLNINLRDLNDLETNNNQFTRTIVNQNINEEENEQEQIKKQKYEFYFQTKIRNTGFWGKVKLRKGTWMVILGLILMSIGIVMISVFWRWWYGPEVNIPCRVIGITLLIFGFFSFIFGLISNFMMIVDPRSKHFLGAPPRWSSWLLLGSIIALTIASDLMTIYYTYWHNRYVNTPLIIISIILFFFGPIAFFYSLYYNIKQMRKAMGKVSKKKE